MNGISRDSYTAGYFFRNYRSLSITLNSCIGVIVNTLKLDPWGLVNPTQPTLNVIWEMFRIRGVSSPKKPCIHVTNLGRWVTLGHTNRGVLFSNSAMPSRCRSRKPRVPKRCGMVRIINFDLGINTGCTVRSQTGSPMGQSLTAGRFAGGV